MNKLATKANSEEKPRWRMAAAERRAAIRKEVDAAGAVVRRAKEGTLEHDRACKRLAAAAWPYSHRKTNADARLQAAHHREIEIAYNEFMITNERTPEADRAWSRLVLAVLSKD